MGEKYIIELGDNELAYQTIIIEGTPYIKPLQLLSYTDPDLEREQVRKEAYEKGFDAGRMLNKGKYEKGLNDAWEAARKIIHMPEGDLLNIFTECYSAVCTALQVILKYDASEAIEKLKDYEQEQEDDACRDKEKVIALANDIGIHKLYALAREIRGE